MKLSKNNRKRVDITRAIRAIQGAAWFIVGTSKIIDQPAEDYIPELLPDVTPIFQQLYYSFPEEFSSAIFKAGINAVNWTEALSGASKILSAVTQGQNVLIENLRVKLANLQTLIIFLYAIGFSFPNNQPDIEGLIFLAIMAAAQRFDIAIK